jgi:hypothetical protein
MSCDCRDFCIDEVPLPRSDAHYFSFDLDARYLFSIAGVELPSSPGVEATLVFDRSDPYFFLTGSVMSIPGLPLPLGASRGGFGFSWNDEIPFVPLSTYPFDGAIAPFRGGYAALIKLPIFGSENERAKVLLEGTLVASLDPDEDGDHPFLTPKAFGKDPDLALGANGAFSVRFSPFKGAGKKDKGTKPGQQKPPSEKDVRKEGKEAKRKGTGNALLALSFDVGAASAVGRIHSDHSDLSLSGTLGDQQSLLPEWMPLPVKGAAGTRMAAYFSTQGAGSYVQAEGTLGLDTSTLARWANLAELGVVLGVDGFLRADQNGFVIRGTTGSSMHPLVAPTGAASVEAHIAPNGIDTYVTLRGAATVAGEGFPDAELTLSPRGMKIAGTLALASQELEMRGSFRAESAHLEGGTQIDIPYEREDTQRKLELLDEILNQSEVVALGELTLAEAEAALEQHRENAEAVAADLARAIADVSSLQTEIDALGGAIAAKQSALAAQQARDCSQDYTGCGSCSSCTSRCSCGSLDVACHLDCGVCQTARTACLGLRESCRLANVAGCEIDRAARVAGLGTEIGALETARAGVIAAKDVALAVLGPIQAANDLALAALRTAESTAEAAQAGLDAAQANLANLRNLLEHLPPIEGNVSADLTLVIDTGPEGTRKRGKVVGRFEGIPIGEGQIDLEAQPPIACVTVPLEEIGELCTRL